MRSVGGLLAAFFLAAMSLSAQKAQPAPSSREAAKTFRLDPRWPFVYLKFDHIGEGARLNQAEPSTRIWLHLVNNCRVPIVVPGGQPIEDGLPGEVLIDNVVKLNPSNGIVIFSGSIEPDVPHVGTTVAEPTQPPNQEGARKNYSGDSRAQAESAGNDEARMPLGYLSSDVVSTDTILPGQDVLFSVPINFVTKEWHFEISFDLASEQPDEGVPEKAAFVNPNVRGNVELILSYGFYDLPQEHRDEVERINRALQKRR